MLGPVRETYSQRRSTAEPTGVIIECKLFLLEGHGYWRDMSDSVQLGALSLGGSDW